MFYCIRYSISNETKRKYVFTAINYSMLRSIECNQSEMIALKTLRNYP